MSDRAEPGTGSSPRSWFAAAWVSAAAFFLLGGYELVRSPANTMFKAAYGKENLPYVIMATPPFLFAVLYGYGRILSKYGPRWALRVTTLLSALALGACGAGCASGWRPAAAILYLVREAYVVLVLEQYWSFLNSTLSVEDGKKLNGPICGLASVGSILGALAVGAWSETLGTETLPFIGAAALLPALLCGEMAYGRCGEPRPEGISRAGGHVGFRALTSERTMRFLFALILATQTVSLLLEISFQGVLQDAIPVADQQTAWSGRYFALLNAAALLGQFVLAPLALRFLSPRRIHVAIPVLHIAFCLWAWIEPSLMAIGCAYLMFKWIDYSVFRAAKELLYVPLSFDVRYRAKELIDVFGYRLGKGGSSLVLTALKGFGVVFGNSALAGWAALVAGLWTPLGWIATKRDVSTNA